MTKIGFLVDGQMEQDVIQALCPGSPVRRINCNGDAVAVAAIAKRVASLARLMQRRCKKLIVVFDREKRKESSIALEQEFMACLKDEGFEGNITAVVADRCTENWILADSSSLATHLAVHPERICGPFESKNGVSEMRKILPRGKKYEKIIDGVRWLCMANPRTVAKNSESFRRLYDILKPLDCVWLNSL